MQVKFKCPACGHKDVASPEMAGEKVNCRKCGQKIRLPARKPAAPVAAASSAPSAKPRVPAAMSPVPSLAPQYICTVCNLKFPVDQVYNQDGSLICKGCFDAQQSPEPQDVAPDEPVEPVETDAGLEQPVAVSPEQHCAACGTPVDMDFVEQVNGQLMCASCAMLAAATSARTATAQPVRKAVPLKKQPPYGLWIGGGVAAVVVIGIIVIVLTRSGSTSPPVQVSETAPVVHPKVVPAPVVEVAPPAPAPVPEDLNSANLTRLVELRQTALEQEAKADVKGALATYQQMVTIVDGTPNPNDLVQSQRKIAQDKVDSLTAQIAAATPANPAPAEPAPAPTPAPVATAIDSKPTPPPTPAPVVESNGNWEQQHTAEIKRLLNLAQQQLAANNTFNAALTYQQLFQLVGSHLPDIQDAELRRQISSAATNRGRLLVQVKSSPETVALTAGTMLASGLEALHESRWMAGVESLTDVRDLFDRNVKMIDKVRDPNYIMALHGLAVAYLSTKQTPKAGVLFEDTAPLGAAVDREPTRELVINRAVTDIIQRTKAMRAAKSLRTYLEKHPSDEPDEQLLNLLGTSLFVAEQHTAAKGFLEQCAKLYEAQNERLEKTRPGQRRWGIEWMSAREVARKFDERAVLIQNAAELAQQAAAAAAESNHQQEMVNSYYANGARKTTPAAAQAAMNLANNLARAAAAAKAKIPNLPWLTDLEPVLPPMPKGLQVVAADTSDTGTAPSVFTIPTITLHDAPTPPRPSIKEKPEMETPPPVEIAPPPPRKPVHISIPRHALAFAIDKNRLITSAEVVGDIRSVRMENADGQVYSAHVIAKEGSLALLELDGGSGQLRYLNLAESFAGGPVTCTAVPQENVFGPQPVSLTGQAMVPAQGEMSVSLNDHPRLAGSPLLNAQGQIVGVVVAKRDDMKTRLPVVGVSEIRKFLSAHSALPAAPSGNGDPMGVFEVTVQEN